ncbi:MAG: glycosyltransferase family 39 protein, partial [Chloroflexi bacterium]|nr:glycosyltransferase family 39 protein [Chloroflexota bacterium]
MNNTHHPFGSRITQHALCNTQSKVVLFIILLFGFAFRVHNLGAQSFWLDEAYTWGVVTRTTWGDVWSAMWVVSDVSPLYYVLAKLFTPMWGASEFGLRILSAFFGWLAIVVTYRLGRAMFDERVGIFASAIIALSPFAIWYSQDARPYGLYLFLAALVLWGLHRAERGRGWKIFIAVSALLYLTHYVAALFAYAQAIYVLTRLRAKPKLFRQWFMAQSIAAVPIALWVIIFLLQRRPLTANTWIPAVTLLTPLQTLWNFVSGDAAQWTLWMMIGVIALIILMITGARTFSVAAQLLMWWLVLPIFTAWAFSLRIPAYVDRFFEPALLSVALLLASGLMAVPSSRLRTLMIALTLLAMSFASTRLFNDSTFTKEDWRGVTRMIVARGLPVAVTDSETMLGMTPYLPSPLGFIPIRSSADLTNQLAQGSFILVTRSPHESAHALGEVGRFDPLTESSDDVVRWFKTHPEIKITSHRFVGA